MIKAKMQSKTERSDMVMIDCDSGFDGIVVAGIDDLCWRERLIALARLIVDELLSENLK
jgi:hypothetical protein